jgi:ABC-type Zn uptake system ZnuABC Zn-binding protein ZnuA
MIDMMRRSTAVLVLLLSVVTLMVLSGCLPEAATELPNSAQPPAPADPAELEDDYDDHNDLEQSSVLTPVTLSEGERLRVVATTSVIGDLAARVGGDRIDLTTLVPPGTDPHVFQATPRDAATLSDAHLVLANGVGLEVFLGPLLESAAEGVAVAYLYPGIELREMDDGDDHADDDSDSDHDHGDYDPHYWLAPHNGAIMVRNIGEALAVTDPANAAAYQQAVEALTVELEALDAWVAEEVSTIPEERRLLVTDHDSFGYYADRYGLTVVGTVVPSVTTAAGPSARELAELQDTIRDLGVRAVFVGEGVSSMVAQRVAEDTGIQLVSLFDGSLGGPGSGAETYADMIRYNTRAIVEALR